METQASEPRGSPASYTGFGGHLEADPRHIPASGSHPRGALCLQVAHLWALEQLVQRDRT